MCYWIVKKYDNGNIIYVSGLDANGNPTHTEDKGNAMKFHDLGIPMALYYSLDYCIEKKY